MSKQKTTNNIESIFKNNPKLTITEIEKKTNKLFKNNYFPENDYDNYMNLIMEVLVFNKNLSFSNNI